LPGFGPALSQKDGTARDLLSACGGAVRGAEAGPATADTPVATAPRSLGLIRQKGTNVIVDSDGRGYDDAEFRPFADRGWLVTRGVAPWIGRRGNQAVFARTRGELVRMLQHRTTSRPAAGTSSTTTNDEGTTP
jgi:hypothetical protein